MMTAVPPTRSDEASGRARLPIVILLVLSLLAVLGDSAWAGLAGLVGNQTDYNANGVNIRTGPATTYTSLGLGYMGQGACVDFQTQGESINGDSAWDHHTNNTTLVTGYSANWFIANFAGAPEC